MSEQIIQWRGTVGVGDTMQALNVCHYWSRKNKRQVRLQMNWNHGPDFLYHPDDPETIHHRMDFIHSKYFQNDRVIVEHIFDSPNFKFRHWDYDKVRVNFVDSDIFDHGTRTQRTGAWFGAEWLFAHKEFVKPKKKVVVFHHGKNAEPPRRWKRILEYDDWQRAIHIMQGWSEYDVVELDYRTPIEIAYRQIQTCEFVVCYDGMWHWIARNFLKPMLIPSHEGITSYNTPNAFKAKDKETFFKMLDPDLDKFRLNTLPILQERVDEWDKKTKARIKYD
jgi:hypothetical protein